MGGKGRDRERRSERETETGKGREHHLMSDLTAEMKWLLK